MKKYKTNVQVLHSVKEYEKKYYPESVRKQSLELDDPDTLGIILARDSLNKFKQMIKKEKLCI